VMQFAKKGELTLNIEGEDITLTPEEVMINRNERDGFAVETDGEVTVALVTDLNDELINEGFAREVVNKIQNMRKSSGFEVTDYINVVIGSDDRLKTAIRNHEDFIRRETLANSISFADSVRVDNGKEWNINGEKTSIAVIKV